MFGLIDKLYASRKLRKGYVEPELNWGPEIVHHNGKEISWFCFVPRSVSEMPLLRKGIIPKDGDVFVYTVSSLNLIKPSPEETAGGLQKIYDDAIERMNASSAKGHTLKILGVSLGNVLSIRAAGSINSRIEQPVSIVGGRNPGLSAWDSILTGHISKQSERYGCSSPEEYEKRLSIFSPINYIDGIMADKISIRLGTRDLMIPFKQGRELACALIERGKKTRAKIDYKAYWGAGHTATIFFSALHKVSN